MKLQLKHCRGTSTVSTGQQCSGKRFALWQAAKARHHTYGASDLVLWRAPGNGAVRLRHI